MGLRERVQAAVNASTGRAEKVLNEAAHADEHERLTILVNGWFQGIAAALEEIAIELDRRAAPNGEPVAGGRDTAGSPRSSGGEDDQPKPKKQHREEPEPSESSDETTLLEKARHSTNETQALRAERESGLEDTQNS